MVCRPHRSGQALSYGQPFYHRASDVADSYMRFLDSLRVSRGNVQQKIHFAAERAACFASESNEVSALRPARFYAAHNVHAGAAGRKRNENVLASDKRFDLPRENALKSVIVAGSCEDGWISGKRQRRQPMPFGLKLHHKLCGEMARVGRTAAISEKDDFSAPSQRRRAFFSELSDASDKLFGKALLHPSAFLELPPDFIRE